MKAIVQEYFRRLFTEKDLSVCDELLSPNYIDHDAPPGTPAGPVETKRFVAAFLLDYPDMRISIEDILAEGNEVAARLVWRGTHRETGETYHRMGIVMFRLNEAGQIEERWSAYSNSSYPVTINKARGDSAPFGHIRCTPVDLSSGASPRRGSSRSTRAV